MFGDSITASNEWENAFIVKFDGSDGTRLWSDSTTAGIGEYGEQVAVDPNGNVYLC
ncbi:MAG: hypothetical protein H6767_09365 [Candidatus Peribacteria bacterium]|nr:MAG: hypothetical protein H6767_09365 [Candidatus Peribacteria bacterium]